MIRVTTVLMTLALSAAAPAVTVTAVPNPRLTGGWVADQAQVLDTTSLARLNAKLGALNQANGAEVAVVTVTDTGTLSSKEFATALFNTWGIGQAGADNGVLLLVDVGGRKVEIETGYGVESVLTDARCGEILDDRVVPAFQRGDLAGGVTAGAEAIVGALSGQTFAAPATAAPTSPSGWNETAASPRGMGWLTWLLGVLAAIASAVGLGRALSRPKCPAGHGRMRRLKGEDEAEHLDELQRLEQQLGGIRYSVWQCGECDMVITQRHLRGNDKVEVCPRCDRVTVEVTRPARDQLEKECRNPACDYHRRFRLLSEAEEDAHLTVVQQMEEKLGGVSYHVWRCETTGELSIERKLRALSHVQDCPQCGNRTLQTSRRVISYATRHHSGLEQIESICLAPGCAYRTVHERIIPRIVESSNTSWSSGSSSSSSSSSGSSGSSGGSFGGGSSGGGGAGRSW